MEKLKAYFKTFDKYHILLIIIIAVQLCYTTYVFAFEKQGVHSDEIWSYGLANSYYQPFIYMQDDVFIDNCKFSDIINMNEWTTGDTYNDYITVQDGEQFAYKSVYHNQTLDHHPPLYYALLHTVCSFFPNTFSYWFSYFLNCIFLILTQTFLFKFVKAMANSEPAAILSCLLYGAGIGALSTFIFLRQYSMLTAIGVIYAYFNAALYKSENINLKKYLPAVAITAFLAFMTHYTAIAFVGVYTACFCIYLLCRKKIKKMFIYGGTVLGTLLLYLLVYPASLNQIGGYSTESTYLPYESQIRRLSSYLTGPNFGFRISVFKSEKPAVILAVIILLAALAVPLCFLFRKETWFIKFKNCLFAYVKAVAQKLKSFNFIWLFTAAGVVTMILVIAKITDVVQMGKFSMRYIFMTFPLACALVCTAVYKFVETIPKLKRFTVLIVAVAVAATSVRVNITSECAFLFEQPENYQQLDELLDGKNCVIILDAYENAWLMTCYVQYVRNADNVFFTSADTFELNIDKLNALGEKIDYVIVCSSNFIVSDEDAEALGIEVEDASDNQDTEDENFQLTGLDDVLGEQDIPQCKELIGELNDSAGYNPLFYMNIQGGMYYVLELN